MTDIYLTLHRGISGLARLFEKNPRIEIDLILDGKLDFGPSVYDCL